MNHRISRKTSPAIEVADLVKMFGSNQALAGINLTVAQGNIHALLGPNGSGKTTVVRVLTTLLKPTAGRIRVLGYDVRSSPAEVRARIALTGQFASQDEDLTGSENLRLVARLNGFRGKAARQRARVLLEAFELSDAANRQVKHYSGGMRRRLDIAGSLVVPPEILFLDEPTTGLDPRSRGAVWDVVRSMAAMGTTILLTTQYLEEADQLADRITVIDQGRMVAEGTSSELKARTGSRVLKVGLVDSTRLADAQAVFAEVIGADALSAGDSTTLKLTLKDPTIASRVLEELTKRGIEPQEFSMSGPTLDEAFLELTKSPDAGQEVSS